LDPIFTYYKEYDAFYSKHFRCAYQKEFRICFIPFEDIIELNPIELNIGSLKGCCETINLEET